MNGRVQVGKEWGLFVFVFSLWYVPPQSPTKYKSQTPHIRAFYDSLTFIPHALPSKYKNPYPVINGKVIIRSNRRDETT